MSFEEIRCHCQLLQCYFELALNTCTSSRFESDLRLTHILVLHTGVHQQQEDSKEGTCIGSAESNGCILPLLSCSTRKLFELVAVAHTVVT
jgi:hypothetical protein